MRTITILPKLLFLLALAFYAGCGEPTSGPIFPFDLGRPDLSLYARYAPARIDILPITSITSEPTSSSDFAINVYVCLLDSFGSQIKAPATFRFELFQQLQRSTNPKGKRIAIWPDIDLTDPTVNNNRWQDFLRAYLLSLPLQQRPADACILHVTCISLSGQRLSADFLIRPGRNAQPSAGN
jgi:hypothetical protein